MDLTFRPVREDDLDVILDLLKDDALGQGREALLIDDRDRYAAALARISKQPDNDVIVAELDGQVVGTFQLTFIDNLSLRASTRAQIEAVRVRAGQRGKGVGGRMMRWAIDRARDRNCGLVQLTTNRARGEAAKRFYEGLGFEATHHGMKLYL